MNPNNPKLYEIKPKSMSSEEIERWLRSVQADLEEPGVFVPEMNSIRWDWDAEENKDKPTFAFLIPVPYRGAIANLGINILHEEMNRYRNQICERIYYPYPKLFRRLIKNNIPLFSNESFHQAKDFEVLGISSYYPLQFLGFPRLLKMSGMEPLAKDRKEEDPIIMFGGVAAFNPAPVADFVDVVNLGDGEGVLADAVQMVHDLRKAGKSKYDILVELQKKVPGVYVPALYKEEYYSADDPHRPNQFKAHVPLRDDIPVRIKKVTCEIKDVRPVSKIIQPNSLGDDMSSGAVEITRGCFAAGTMITTEDGFVPIEQVKPGTKVLSYRADGTPCLSVSQGAVQTNVTEVLQYKMKGGSIRCTHNHKFLTSSLSWEAAKDVLHFKHQLFVQKKRQHTFDRDAFLTSLIASDMCFTEKATANGRPMKFEQKASRPGLQYLESLGWHSDVYSRREGMRVLNFYPDSKGYDFTLKMFGRFSCSSDKKPLLKVSPENAASIVYGCMAGDRTTRRNPSQFVLSSQSEDLAKFYGTALSMLGIRYNWMVLNDANRKFPRYCCRVQHYEDLLRLKDIAEQFSSIVPCDVDWSFIKEAKKKERYTFGSAISLGVQPVYDMTVEDTHCYVADGFVVHNCGHKSFAKGTLISTDKGLVPIENVTSEHKILIENPDGTREFTEQLGSFSTGIKQTSLYRIAGTSKEFECTDDHRFAVKNFDGTEGITSYVDAQRIAENPNNLDYSLYVPNAIIGEFDRGAYDCGLAISSSQSTELSQENVASFVLGLMRSCFLTEEDRAGYLTKAAFDLLSPEAKNLVANALTLCGIRWEEGENSISVLRSDLFKLVVIQQEYASEVAPIKEYKVYAESTALYLEKIEELGEQEVWDIETQVHNFYANGTLVHNCSFCEGSFRSMPYRERNLEDIYKAIDDTLLDSGSSSLTPYAFNLSDHHRIFDILQYAMTKWPTRIGMSSQHINHFSEQMADMALMTGTRSITIALESADPVMRRRIGKTLTDETVERVFRLIIRKGFTSIKVYMISNLPMEDDESLHEIENFSRKLIRWQIEEQSPNFASKEEAHAYVSRPEFDEEIDKFAASCKLAFRNKTKIIPEGEEYWNLHLKYKLTTRIKFSYTSFNGKAHTPMQWAQVLPLDEEGFPSIRRDMHTIFDVIQACGHSFRMSGDLEISTLNQVLSYADRRFSQVLIDLCNDERFNYMGTLVAGSNNTMKDFADLMAGRGFDFKFFYREKELDEPFPWDFINMGVTRAYLEKRWQMYKSATDDIRCQEECTKCGGCTKVSRELFKRYWNEGLEEKKYKFEVTPIIKRENTCKIRFRFRMRPEYRWLYGFNKKQWLRRAFYRAGFPIRTNISLASDGIEFNNFTYGADYGEVWLYSKNFDKNNIVERLNATFDEAEPLLQFEDVMVGESASTFKEDVGSIAYSVQIPSKMYTKATLDGHIQSLLNKDEIIIKQKVASSIKRDSTETISIDVKDKLSQLFSVGDEGFTTVYFKLTYGINPYSLLVTLLNTSLSRCKKFPIEVRDYLGRDNEDSFDMFAEICEECGEPIERNIFDDVIGDKYCLKCATLHEKQVLVANLDAEDTDDDSDLDNFDLSFFEDDDMADTNEELHGDE